MTSKEDKVYHCPRCGGYDLIDYGECFDRVECNLEFDKKDLDEFDDDEVLSNQEKGRFGSHL